MALLLYPQASSPQKWHKLCEVKSMGTKHVLVAAKKHMMRMQGFANGVGRSWRRKVDIVNKVDRVDKMLLLVNLSTKRTLHQLRLFFLHTDLSVKITAINELPF